MPKAKTEKKGQVLDELKRHGNISRAARAAGVDRRTIGFWRERDRVFDAAATKAIEIGRG